MTLLGGHGIYGGPEFPDPHPFRTHPAIEASLLDRNDPIWNPTNFYLWSYPHVLYPYVGERMVRAANASLSHEERARAKNELAQLQGSIKRFFRASPRSPGRPPKLTPSQRANMKQEYRKLLQVIGAFSKRERPTRAELDALFKDAVFVDRLLHESPARRATDPREWNAFLRRSRRLPLSDRCVHYLAFRYGTEPSTIQHAIWRRSRAPEPTA